MRFKTEPFRHQLEEFERSRAFPARAILWEQGTGKTKLAIDTAAWLFLEGQIRGVLVVAPNGVHENWVTDELPRHVSPDVRWAAHSYSSRRAGTKDHARRLAELGRFDGLAVLAMSYDAFMTGAGRDAAERFMASRRCLMIADESHRIKTPSAKRTRAMVYGGRRAAFRRILTGTPITNKPFDIYTQIKFLDENFWKREGRHLGIADYTSFKTYFGIWEERINNSTGGRFQHCVAFRHLDQLKEIVDRIATRVTKDDVLDLPPKVYTQRYFDLSPAQERAYREVKENLMTVLASGETITTQLVIVQLLRLQQIACGYVPHDDCETIEDFPENPRLSALLDALEDVEGKAIIFARFRRDVDKIMEALGPEAVRYDGAVDEVGRFAARHRFQDGDARWFVGNPAAAGTGLTLHAAATVVYYSNSFNLEHRLQSEDRAHRIGQTRSVRYVDLMASGTVDVHIVEALRKKIDIAAKITGDEIRTWL